MITAAFKQMQVRSHGMKRLSGTEDDSIKDRLANDKNWHSMRGNRAALESTARQVIYKEIRSEVTLPTLEEWSKANSQGELFSRDYPGRP